MPKRPDKACRVLGCPHVAPCPLHGRQVTEPLRQAERDRGRLSAHRRGYGAKWRGFAERYFAELCRLSPPQAYRLLKRLEKQGKIRQTSGSTKGVRYGSASK